MKQKNCVISLQNRFELGEKINSIKKTVFLVKCNKTDSLANHSYSILKRFALIGQPLGHSLSPYLHKFIYRQLEIDDASYRTVELSEEQLKTFFSGFRVGGFDGINITVPHKTSVLSRLDEIESSAKILSAVNCIHRVKNKLHGYNTDVLGFEYLLQKNAIAIQDNNFLLLGAGGSARAVALVLAQGNAAEIAIYNRSQAAAEELQGIITQVNPDTKVVILPYGQPLKLKAKKYVFINTTYLGMSPNIKESPLAKNQFEQCSIAVDLIYNPLQTQFLRHAESAGIAAINGLQMLVAQAVYSVEIWMGGNIVAHVDMNALVKDTIKAIK